MPGFDWNGNGRHDAFDSFMDMKIINDATGDNSDDGTEFEDSETGDSDYIGGGFPSGYVNHVSLGTYNETIDAFHLKNN